MEPIGLSITDAGTALGGASRNTIYRMIGRGELEAIKIGTRTIVTTASIRRVAECSPAGGCIMKRLQGTLSPKKRESHRDGNRGGFHISSILAGAVEIGNCNQNELQVWTDKLLRSVREFDYRQQQRTAADRARLIIARREVFNVG